MTNRVVPNNSRCVYWPNLGSLPKIVILYEWHQSLSLDKPMAETSIGRVEAQTLLPLSLLEQATRLYGQYESVLYEYWNTKQEFGAVEP